MVCAPVRSVIPSLKLGDCLSVQAHKPCSISHIDLRIIICLRKSEVAVEMISVCNVIEKLRGHVTHCLPCSYTYDVIIY